jgi:hypothetical protein
MPDNKTKIDLKNIGIKIPEFSNKESDLPLPTQFIEAGAKKETYLKIDLNTANSTKRMENLQNTDPAHYGLRTFFYTLLSILSLISVYFIYTYSQKYIMGNVPATEQKLIFENPLVRADSSRVVSIEAGATKEAIKNVVLQALYNENVAPDKVVLISPSYLKEIEIDGKRTLTPELQRGDDFLFTFAEKAPLALRTIAGKEYAYGVVNNQRENKAFIVLSVTTPQDATRELLRWENEMYPDLKQVLKLKNSAGKISFRDLSSNNNLLRVAEDENGVVLIYGFGAPRTLIIAPDTETFERAYNVLK